MSPSAQALALYLEGRAAVFLRRGTDDEGGLSVRAAALRATLRALYHGCSVKDAVAAGVKVVRDSAEDCVLRELEKYDNCASLLPPGTMGQLIESR